MTMIHSWSCYIILLLVSCEKGVNNSWWNAWNFSFWGHDPATRDVMPADRKPKVIHWVNAKVAGEGWVGASKVKGGEVAGCGTSGAEKKWEKNCLGFVNLVVGSILDFFAYVLVR